MVAVTSQTLEGHVSRGFEAVALAFADNFARRHELGGACCAYVHGEKVVDLWGGIRNKETGEPWERDTRDIALRDALYAAFQSSEFMRRSS